MKKKILFLFAMLGGFTVNAQYCLPTYSSACTSGDFINNVAFNTISNLGSGCTSPGSNYQDYTGTLSTIVQQGTTYPITVAPGPSWGQSFAVYFDFNNDGDFNDAGEFFDLGYLGGGVSGTTPIPIPTGIPGGPTVMRVVCKYATPTLTAADACYSGSFGETEDYEVIISTPLANDAGISAYVTPNLPTCNFADSVRVTLYNYGSAALTSATINWQVGASAQVPVSWTGSLAPFASATVTLGLAPLATGDNLIAFTTNPNGLVEDPAGSWNDTASIMNLQAGLSGIKTIGGTAPDYADIASAVSALTTYGICGPVIFDIRDGVYAENMVLPALSSMSAVNTVTFRSENADPSLVSLSIAGSGATDNFVVKMLNVNHYHFENLTLENTGTGFGTVVAMNGSSSNSFVGCILNSGVNNTTSTNGAVIYSNNAIDSNNVFMNNEINGGSYGMYWYGTGTTAFEKNNVIEGNTFMDQYYMGLSVYYNDGIKIKNNTFSGVSSYTFRYGVYLYYAVGAPEISGNVINGEGNSGWVYGIYYSQGGGNNANHSLVNNNMITVGWPGASSTLYGIYYTGSGYIDTYHNSVLATTGGSSSNALYATGGGGIDVQNNIFANYTSGYAYYVGNAFTIANSDHNVIYSPAGNAGYFSGIMQTLADFQLASSFDANSIDYNPNFYSNNDLHVCSDSIGNQGTPIASITMDIDGHPRSATTPDMGADEFSGLSGSFLGNDVAFCAGDSIQLVAGSPTDTILWSTGATTSSIWVSTPGSYTATVNGACGTGTDAIVVTASALNYAGYVAATDIEFCAGDSVLLYSTQVADTYTWTGGSTNDSLYVTAPGTYNLAIADACGTGNEALTIVMNDVPNASFTATYSYLSGIFANTSTGVGTGSTYAWNFGDGTTSTDVSPTHAFVNSGAHYVTLTVTNDCGSTTFGDTIVISVVGLEEMANYGSVNVYPNPSTGVYQVDLELNDAMDIQMEVTNVMGQVVSTKSISAANGAYTEQVDLTNEAAGVYYLSITSADKKLTNRMLIKK